MDLKVVSSVSSEKDASVLPGVKWCSTVCMEEFEAAASQCKNYSQSTVIVLVAKPDGSRRFCVDYRALNSETKRDLYPLPRCDDILEGLAGAQWFSQLDLLRGYWQIGVDVDDREKTDFASPGSLYQFCRLRFGLTNAPACFMRALDIVPDGLCWSDCLVYLDDIIVFGRTLEEHRERLALVLSRLAEAGLKINPKKCQLLSERVIVLGHVVTQDGISTDPEKIRVVKEWPVPSDPRQLKAFLGTAGHYRQFVPNYAQVARPLYRAEHKGDNFTWSAECQEVFLSIKRHLTNAPILAFPQLDVPFILDTDACDSGLGAVLSKVQGGKERVIAFAARALTKAEKNYSTTRKELLAIVFLHLKIEFELENVCRMYSTPYAKYVRDTLSYIVLAVLHYVLCLSPSTLAFSRLEWVILIFFMGRYLVEGQQFWDIMQRMKKRKEKVNVGFQTNWIRVKTLSEYLSDPWNLLDFISLLVYLIIVTLKVTTLLTSRSEMNNRALAIAGYFYSFNTLCLTMRVFGHVTEQSRHLGVIQIALFNILKDISTIILQFMAGILAFSIAITKVFMTEKSFIANGSAQNDIWWAMAIHLGWSLLGAQETDPLASVDVPSETVAQILYAAFLIFGVILLVNMLIALLCNTWQRTVDNSLKVWTIKRAITIQTYDAYDPVPVPLNIIYNIGKLLRLVGKLLRIVGSKDKNEEKFRVFSARWVIKGLEGKYFKKYKDKFPVTDEDKFEKVLDEERTTRERVEQVEKEVKECVRATALGTERQTKTNRQMVNQVLYTTFSSQGGVQGELCFGPEVIMESFLLRYTDVLQA
ncbi:hypothetical protein ACROYT_G040145 [Oculina patagonica]